MMMAHYQNQNGHDVNNNNNDDDNMNSTIRKTNGPTTIMKTATTTPRQQRTSSSNEPSSPTTSTPTTPYDDDETEDVPNDDNIPREKSTEELLEKFKLLDLHSLGQHLPSVLNDPRDESSLLDTVSGWWYTESDTSKPPQEQQQLNDQAMAAFDVPNSSHSLGVVEPKAYPSSHFSSYINQISPAYYAYEEAKKKLSLEKPKSTTSNPMKSIVEERGVPEIFFDEYFNLPDPATFNEIFPTDAMAASLLLQEKLAHYLDEVEVILLKQVTYRSNGIFDALMQYNELNDQLCAGLPYVRSLRHKIQHLQDITVRKPLEVSKMVRKRVNLINLYKKIESVAAVQQSQATLKLLLSKSDYVSAIDLIESTNLIVKNELSGLICFKNLGQQLKEELNNIEKAMHQEFINITIESGTEELQQHAESIENTEFYSRLMPIIHGLVRMNHIQPALQNYRDEIIRYAKEVIKQTLEDSFVAMNIDSSRQHTVEVMNGKSPPLKRGNSNLNLSPTDIHLLTSMSHENFLQVTSNIFDVLYSLILKTYYVNTIISDFCTNETKQQQQQQQQTAKYMSNMRQSNLRSEMEKVFENICEVCHSRCSIIFTFRNNEVKKMRRKEILEYMNQAFQFIEKSEKLLNKRIGTLRGALSQQGEIYLDGFKEQKKEVLKDVLEKEKWAPIENIAPEFQALLDQLINSSTSSNNNNNNSNNNNNGSKYLIVDEKQFPTCWSFLILLKIVNEYVEMVTPAFNNFISAFELSQGVHTILVEYNNSAEHLVLNAGAVNEITQLSSITAKHILLSSECLHCLVHVIPHIQSLLETRLENPQKRLLKFSDLIKTLKSHQQKLKNKIFSLMQERVKEQAAQGIKYPWDSAPAEQKTPLTLILKDLAYLFKLSDQFLGTHKKDQMEYLTIIIRMFFEKLKNLIEGLRNKVKSKNGKEKLKQEIVQFRLILQKFCKGKLSSDIDVHELETLYDQCFGSN